MDKIKTGKEVENVMQTGLSADEIRICELMGINRHAYIESREQERAMERGLNQETSKSLEREIAVMMGIPSAEIEKVKAQVAKEMAARAPLTPEEVDGCRKLGLEPLWYYAAKLAKAGLKPQIS